ncbi:putative mitochondrial protein AtMg00860 [Nicotiana tabacum]|uniref:Mitochondrial protein AtMg00860 n=1 Tax=Nicotiana tabacum TaxID=4097 RepID=A0AC58RVP9_TOBAC
MQEVVKKEIVKLLAATIIYPISDSPWVSPVQKELQDMIFTVFLMAIHGSWYNQIPIAPEDQDKTTFTCPYGTYAYRRIPFEGIVLGHNITAKGIEVNKAKIDLIEGLPSPTTVKGIRSFLGHTCFYKRFIKDFSKISKPLINLLMKDIKFDFSGDYLKALETLKEKLSTVSVVMSPD